MTHNDVEVFYPKNVSEWRDWLAEYHVEKQSVWLVYFSKKSGKETLTWSEAVDIALCYGWIDSKRVKKDDASSHQFFSKRKPKSTWSKINKQKVDVLIAQGLMTDAGLACIEIAKKNGSWTILDEVEALVIPQDLTDALERLDGANDFFSSLSNYNKKILLSWVALAKTPETRQKRITEIAESAAQRLKPKHLR